MPGPFNDTINLDPSRFRNETRKWNVPLLVVPGISVVELHIDGNVVSAGEYKIEGNYINIAKSYDVDSKTKAYLIVKYNPQRVLITFWLPVIVAVLGFFGTIAQRKI